MEPHLDLLDRLDRLTPAAPPPHLLGKVRRRIAYRERASRRRWWTAAAAAALLIVAEAFVLRDYVAPASTGASSEPVAQLVPTIDNAFSYE